MIGKMNLKEHYSNLYKDSVRKIQADSYSVDKLIDFASDKRYGITLLIRLNSIVAANIQKVLSKIRAIEPNQYFYPNSDLHVTAMSIISCYDGFNINQIRIENYIDIIKNSISGIRCFNIEFRGLTASPSCLMVQGFFEDNFLTQIRDNLRYNFQCVELEQTIDKRYAIQTAHSTIFRLKEELKDKEKFLKTVDEFRNFYFGTIKVDSLELVVNDWYMQKENVKTLYRFDLE